MNEDYIRGIGHQLLGAAKSGTGKIIGDAKLVADGTAELAAGRAVSAAAREGDTIAGIDEDRIEGVGRQLGGAAKVGLGTIIGDTEMQADGTAERSAGQLQNEEGSARDELRDASQKYGKKHNS